MPRIDPHQLLSCLGVLLTPAGGILSKNEVQRLANLMTKFSKKLVSKCIYVLILKNTDVPLLGAFMVEGGWNLVHNWLQDGYNNRNWALVSELLELLLMSPTDVEQLKMNNLPKLVKNLSKREDLEKVKKLANNLVMKWLKIVKDDQIEKNNQAANAEQQNQVHVVNSSITVSEPVQVVEVPVVQVEQVNDVKEKVDVQSNIRESDTSVSANAQPCYKLALRDGKHVLCKVSPSEANVTVVENAIIEDITPVDPAEDTCGGDGSVDEEMKSEKGLEELSEVKEKKEVDKRKEKSNHDRHKHKSSSSSSSKSSSRSSKDRDRSSRDKSREKSKSGSKESSSRERSKDKSRHDKDKHKNNGSLKSSSKSSSSSSSSSKDKEKEKDQDKKETKEKQAERDKDTLAKLQPPSLSKIGRIPKKSSDEKKEEKKDDAKKSTFSIEVRKSTEDKPKTVKVFNAKMRSTGLLEEAKPPPPRQVKKQVSANLPSVLPQKRPSPIRDLIPPPEKKSKTETTERPGAIKLIPPKPKRGGNTAWKTCGFYLIPHKLQ